MAGSSAERFPGIYIVRTNSGISLLYFVKSHKRPLNFLGLITF